MTAVLLPSGGARACATRASASALSDRTQTGTGSRAMSFENISEKSFETLFAERFAKFLRENFANATQVAAVFNVRERTAENWLAGVNAPSGAQVAKAFLGWPGEVEQHLTGQDQCAQSSGQSSASSSSSATSSRQGPTGSLGKRRSA